MSTGLRFLFAPAEADPARTLYVDGTVDGFRSLSHWPGNTTPAGLRHDLSTGIALAYTRLSPAERLVLVGPFDTVCNNHYDTDGALSVFAVMRPAAALSRAPAMLAAAWTGDFGIWQGEAALAVDLTVMGLTRHPASPLAEFAREAESDAQRWTAGYAWLVENLPELLDDPFAHRALWAERFETLLADVQRVADGFGVSTIHDEPLDLALVQSDRPITSLGLHLAAGSATRVLLAQPAADGWRYRFRYRVESWFQLVSRHPPARRPLQEARRRLQVLESGSPQASAGEGPAWWADELTVPVCELGFGDPAARDGAGAFDDPDLTAGGLSRLAPSTVADILRESLRESPRGG